MRIGLVGTGKHGSRYARHIVRDVPGLELSAISRRSAERKDQMREWNCRGYEDWRQLVDDDGVEAVIGVVPPALNLAIARACVRAGKPLLLEKPLAANLEEAGEIVSLCNKNNLPLTVGQTLRYNQVISRFRELLPELGDLYSFSANQRIEPSTLDWHEQPELAGAGVSFHTAVHVFDALRYITGREVERVMAISGRQHNAALEDLLLVLVEMEGGVKGIVDCSKVGRARSGRFEFVCSDGQLVGDQIYNTCARIVGVDVHPVECGEPVGTIRPLLEDWQRFLAGQGENPVSGEDGLRAVQACEGCLESARRGSWVEVAR
ncbi:MAG: Gfo/Idh/MocA family oxidoreductase [Desulfobulbaceae bacterium]|nr:Gfo/Idh/MocA family oxidoreductase [Desulfobulbaceae bacterium]